MSHTENQFHITPSEHTHCCIQPFLSLFFLLFSALTSSFCPSSLSPHHHSYFLDGKWAFLTSLPLSFQSWNWNPTGKISAPVPLRNKVKQLSDPASSGDLGPCSHQGELTCTQRTQVLGNGQCPSPAWALWQALGLQRKPPDQMQSIRHRQKKGTPWRGPVASKEREDYWHKIMGGKAC